MITPDEDFDQSAMYEAIRDEQAAMVDNIAHLAQIDAQIKPLEAAREHLRGQIKQYMQLNTHNLDCDEGGKPVLWHPDLQTGYVLTTVQKMGYDTVSLAKSHPEVVIKAALAGYVTLDRTALKRHPGAAWIDTITRYEQATSGTDRLDRKDK